MIFNTIQKKRCLKQTFNLYFDMNLFLKIILLPFSMIYGIGIIFRNIFYDLKIIRSYAFPTPLICVGNINTGGTGKTPAIEYIIRTLLENNITNLFTLSRGYGRKTKGYILADSKSTAELIGDEPLQFFLKFPEIQVAVCEKRAQGIHKILNKFPSTQCILLDDAYQHRAVRAGLNILLTVYDNLYSNDLILPSGRLREFRSAAKRAKIIIVTKCPANISETKKDEIIKRLKPEPHQKILFSSIKYLPPVAVNTEMMHKYTDLKEVFVLLFSGIANPESLEKYLNQNCKTLFSLRFKDHHVYSEKDMDLISGKFLNIVSENKIIITTEKDYSRLCTEKTFDKYRNLPLFYIPVEMEFQEKDKIFFNQTLLDYVRKNQ